MQARDVAYRKTAAQLVAMQSQLAKELHLRRTVLDAQQRDLQAQAAFNRASAIASDENAMANKETSTQIAALSARMSRMVEDVKRESTEKIDILTNEMRSLSAHVFSQDAGEQAASQSLSAPARAVRPEQMSYAPHVSSETPHYRWLILLIMRWERPGVSYALSGPRLYAAVIGGELRRRRRDSR